MKRSRSPEAPTWQRQPKSPRRENGFGGQSQNQSFARELAKRNQAKENEHMRQWVSQEDDFVLTQAKRKAKIRVREGRANPVDWLAVCLGVTDLSEDILEEESVLPDFVIPEPSSVINGVQQSELATLEKDIEHYLTLEHSKENKTFWSAAKVLCRDRLGLSTVTAPSGRGVKSVSADIDKVLEPKSLEQLLQLEKQVNQKLDSNEPIDEDYWEQLLVRIGVFKAKAQLSKIHESILTKVADIARAEHVAEAERLKSRYASSEHAHDLSRLADLAGKTREPETTLSMSSHDARVISEADFMATITTERETIRTTPALHQPRGRQTSDKNPSIGQSNGGAGNVSPAAPALNEDSSKVTKALYDREAARGVQEDEEVFEEEETVSSSKPKGPANSRLRKPRYFNRVQMGYEWNKYNQTHYDQDNPPPKVVQGYKFNIFYPELIDKTKAPTYRVERENGRKRGQTLAPAGEEDTCIIRFIADPPYEDVAFRVVDKEWDYSARRERGFRSSFEKDILQLHFHFKKVYYRK